MQGLTQSERDDLARCLALLAQKWPDLAEIIEAWPDLPEHIKAAIKALIRVEK